MVFLEVEALSTTVVVVVKTVNQKCRLREKVVVAVQAVRLQRASEVVDDHLWRCVQGTCD